MNKKWAAIAAGAVVVAAGAVAVAIAADWRDGSGKGRHGKGHGRGSAAYLLQFDADKDGRITRGEIDSGLTAQFAKADANGDGKLDAAEFQKHNDALRAERKARIEAWRAKRTAEGGDVKRERFDHGPRNFDPLKRMDWNLDGFISPDEFAGRTRAQAMRADRDGDGTILAEDLTKHRHGRGRGADPAKSGAPKPL